MSTHISTRVGELFVTELGSGPPTVFRHSLFVGQRSWDLVVQALADDRRVMLIDGPNHGRSKPVDHDFTIEDCAVAAGEVLDQLDTSEPVHWVGNAFGGMSASPWQPASRPGSEHSSLSARRSRS